MKIRRLASALEVARFAARSLEEICRVRDEGRLCVAFSGGSTPKLFFDVLAAERATTIPWDRIEVFFVDERPVPADHRDSNYRLAFDSLLSKVAVPASSVHRMPADEDDLVAAAQRYEDEVRRVVPPDKDGVPAFDMIWLGMGNDGHTASLFPGTEALEEVERLVLAHEVPAVSGARMTFTLPLLNHARRVQFLVTGGSKALMLARVLHADDAFLRYPAARVQPTAGFAEWLTDREAASEIERFDGLTEGTP